MFNEFWLDSMATSMCIIIMGFAGGYLVNRDFFTRETIGLVSRNIEYVVTTCLILSTFLNTLNISDVISWVPAMLIPCYIFL